jgi:xanthine/uracil permease
MELLFGSIGVAASVLEAWPSPVGGVRTVVYGLAAPVGLALAGGLSLDRPKRSALVATLLVLARIGSVALAAPG